MIVLGVGICVIILGVAGAGFMVLYGIKPFGALGFGFLALAAGIVIVNIQHIKVFGAESSKGKAALGVEMQDAVTEVREKTVEVRTDAAQVRQIKTQVELLAHKIDAVDQRITTAAQQTQRLHDDVQQAYRALFEVDVYSVYMQSLFAPPFSVIEDFVRGINVLAKFAYNNPAEQAAALAQIDEAFFHAPPHVRAATPVSIPAPHR